MCEEHDKKFQGILLKRIAPDTMKLSGWFYTYFIILS